MRAFNNITSKNGIFNYVTLLNLIFMLLTCCANSENSLTINNNNNNNNNRKCGKIPIEEPLNLNNNNNNNNHMLLCISQKLFLRTSLGLFPISSINYTTKLLTISQISSSNTIHSLLLSFSNFPKISLLHSEKLNVTLRTRMSFDIPDHVPKPNICNECVKANGNCGVALSCICHPKECKDKVISRSTETNIGYGNIILILVSLIYAIVV